MKKSKMIVDKYGDKIWILDGKIHRVDGPAIERKNGDKYWFLNDKKHRIDGPAVIYEKGDKEWFLNGKCHRADGPAVEYTSEYKRWFLNGKEVKIRDFQRKKVYNSGWNYLNDRKKIFILNEYLNFWEKYVKEIIKKKWFYISKIDKIEVKTNKKARFLSVITNLCNSSIATISFPNLKFSYCNNEFCIIHEIAHVLEQNLYFDLIIKLPDYINRKMFASHGEVFCGCMLFLLRKIKGKKEEKLLKNHYDKNGVKYISNISEIIKIFKESGKNSKKACQNTFFEYTGFRK